ncbi:MAG: hypothetical protein ACP5HK_07365, partial [Acidilobus sp.]
MSRLVLLAVAVIAVVAVTVVAEATVVFVYSSRVSLTPVEVPFRLVGLPPPQCRFSTRWSVLDYGSWENVSGLAFTLMNVTPAGQVEYQVWWPVVLFNLSSSGVVGLWLNSTRASFTLGPGLWPYFLPPVGSNLTAPEYLYGNVSYSAPSSGITYYYNWTVYLSPPPDDVVSWVNGQSYQVSPLVYQGDNNGVPTRKPSSRWPRDISGANAGSYWDKWYVGSSLQPLMDMTGYDLGYNPSAGVVFWSSDYAGGNVTVALVTTYSNSISMPPGHGVEIYLFVKPSGWSVSTSNFSIRYMSSEAMIPPPSPVMGDVIYPEAKSGTT